MSLSSKFVSDAFSEFSKSLAVEVNRGNNETWTPLHFMTLWEDFKTLKRKETDVEGDNRILLSIKIDEYYQKILVWPSTALILRHLIKHHKDIKFSIFCGHHNTTEIENSLGYCNISFTTDINLINEFKDTYSSYKPHWNPEVPRNRNEDEDLDCIPMRCEKGNLEIAMWMFDTINNWFIRLDNPDYESDDTEDIVDFTFSKINLETKTGRTVNCTPIVNDEKLVKLKN